MSKTKHEILFSRFGVNYNAIDERYRKGSVLVIEPVSSEGDPSDRTDVKPAGKKAKEKPRMTVNLLHCDIIEDRFWTARPHLLQ